MNSRGLFAAVLPALLLACSAEEKKEPGTTLLLTVEAEASAPPPEYLLLTWSGDGEVLRTDERLPATGTLRPTGERLGSVAIAVRGAGERVVVARGIAGERVVAEGAVRAAIDGAVSHATLRLAAGRMPDADRDGVPDAVDNCPEEQNAAQTACAAPEGDASAAAPDRDATPGPPDGGAADAGGADGPADGVSIPPDGTDASAELPATSVAPPDAGAVPDAILTTVRVGRGKPCKQHDSCESGSCAEGRAGRFCASPDMVVVPAGTFPRGCQAKDVCARDERPAKMVQVKGFEIDRTEVTQGAYEACVRAGRCETPTVAWNPTARSRHPVTGVTWAMADRFCRFAGKRLPTEAEWEKAARGPDAPRVYPWGDTPPTCSQAQFSACGVADVVPVGVLTGTSFYGVEDMAGNATEWVADLYDPEYYGKAPATDPPGPSGGGARVRRGGAFYSDASGLRAAARSSGDARELASQGFRCARDLP